MVKIEKIKAREILDSRGNPTVEVEIQASGGIFARASVPSGASKGIHEAVELRDEDPHRYGGLGVTKVCRLIEETIQPCLKGKDTVALPDLDQSLIELDGTPNKSRLGANATLAVSLAAAKAGAMARGVPLYRHLAELYGTKKLKIPTPFLNFINGGRHANNGINVQEFMVLPESAPSFKEALRQASEIFAKLKATLAARKDSCAVGDEGGFAPLKLTGPEEAIELLLQSIREAGYANGTRVSLDLAASEFCSERGYELWAGRPPLSAHVIIQTFSAWCSKYSLASLEDPLDQDDWGAWSEMTKALGRPGGPWLIGDDIFVTNPERLKRGLNEGVANAILIKPNQIGTISETARVVRMAKDAGYGTVASHRSGETEDPALAHVAVGIGTDGIKTGSVTRSERLAKYNELLRIEEELAPGSYCGALPSALGINKKANDANSADGKKLSASEAA
ncbi:MAG: phosphopyruvate hydratase [Elusimicrobiota bacterium]|mgnify:CR=1 FL=1